MHDIHCSCGGAQFVDPAGLPAPMCVLDPVAAVRALVVAPPSAGVGSLTPSPRLEVEAFLSRASGDTQAAARALSKKQAWGAALGVVGIEQVAPFYRSEGYSVVLEGLPDRNGDPLVFSNGICHGSEDAVVKQVLYTHERVIEQCVARSRPALRCTTIVNVRNPCFRLPDAACRAAIAASGTHYPWAAAGTTVFVGFPAPVWHRRSCLCRESRARLPMPNPPRPPPRPPPSRSHAAAATTSQVRWTFNALSSFMSAEAVAAIAFADVGELSRYAPRSSLPAELGGEASWSVEEYISARCEAEGAAAAPGVARYRGPRLDLAQFDRLGKGGPPVSQPRAVVEGGRSDATPAAAVPVVGDGERSAVGGGLRRWFGRRGS